MKLWHFNALLGLLWLGLFRYCQLHSYTDPSSFFHDPSRAYEPTYSAVREAEADAFLEKASGEGAGFEHVHEPGKQKSLCVGVPSLRRKNEQFMGRAIASLVDNLDAGEREALHLVVLMSDWNPKDNPAYGQPWLRSITDEVLIYGKDPGSAAAEGYRVVPRDLESHEVQEDARNERVQLDYATLVDACQRQDADYFLLMEDDVIASRDWFSRLRASLPQAEALSQAKKTEWAYLRLFYTERYMGWNSEEWPTYLWNVTLVYVAAMGILYGARRTWFHPKGRTTSRGSPRLLVSFDTVAALVLGLWIPVFVALYFMAGRLLVNSYSAGVHEMPRYGCCAQGLAFPRRHLPLLSQRLKAPPYEKPGDTFIESIADESGMLKYAMVPSVLQHVGIRGSSVAAATRKTTWNFSFEKAYPIA